MASWTQEQLANARLIIDIGRAMNMTNNDISAALVAAMQESSLRNLKSGDKDSAGLFQQRPSMGWGTYQQVTSPEYAITKFYQTLQKVQNRQLLQPWMAAQAVQRSAYPQAYRKWTSDARSFLDKSTVTAGVPLNSGLMGSFTTGQANPRTEPVGLVDLTGVDDFIGLPAGLEEPGQPAGLGPVTMEPQTPQATNTDSIDKLLGMEPNGLRNQIISELQKYLGTPYKWGGASPKAFDCSGLIYYVYNKLGIKPLVKGKPRGVPRVSYDQALIGQRSDLNSLMPGDFVIFGNDAHHIAVWLGDGRILEAPNSTAPVRERALGEGESVWGVHLDLGGF